MDLRKPVAHYLSHTNTLLLAMALFQVLWLAVGSMAGFLVSWRRVPLLLFFSCALCGLLVIASDRLAPKLQRLKAYLLKNETRLLFTVSVLFFAVGVLYANFQRVWPEEHNLHRVTSRLAADGITGLAYVYDRYGWLGAQHPPLVPLLYASLMRLVGVQLMVGRLAGLCFAVGVLLNTYFIGRDLYGRETGLRAALLLLSFPLIVMQASAATNDMPLTFFFSLAVLLFLRLLARPRWWLTVAIGLVVGAGLLTKYTMALISPVLLCYFAFRGRNKRLWPHLAILLLAAVGVFAVWLIFAHQFGVLEAQTERLSRFLGAVTTASDGRQYLLENLLVKLPSDLGPYNIPLLLVGMAWVLRNRHSSDLMILLWIIPVTFLLILTLPGHRYFMPVFPGVALLMARSLDRSPKHSALVVLLALLFCGMDLYLLFDWVRVTWLFQG